MKLLKYGVFIPIVSLMCCAFSGSYLELEMSTAQASIDTDYIESFEEMFAPYQKVLDDFNFSHGTTYGVLTDEQLAHQNKSRQKYYEDMMRIYSNTTPEELKNNLENAYESDPMLSNSDNISIVVNQQSSDLALLPKHLPYYEHSEESEKLIVESFNMNESNGTMFQNLSK